MPEDKLLDGLTELAEQPDDDDILYLTVDPAGTPADRQVKVSNFLLGPTNSLATKAPVAAQYVTLLADGTLTNERVLTAGTGISIADGGAGSTITISSNDGEIDHGALSGLADDGHSASYPLITNFEASRAAIATAWTDLTDGGASTAHKHDHGGQDGLIDDDHSKYPLVSNFEANRATIATNWTDLTDSGETSLHSHAGGAGAPTDAEYVVLTVDGTLSDERVLTGTANQIVVTDNGAGGTVVLSTPQDIHTAATPEFDGLTVSSAAGIDCNPGSDTDTDLITVGVNGTPTLKWDESANAFDFNAIIAIPTTTSTAGHMEQNGQRVFHTYGASNVFIGETSGNFTMTGPGLNVGIGTEVLSSLTDGGGNMAFGFNVLKAVTSGTSNVGIGAQSLLVAKDSGGNVGIGAQTLQSAISGGSNVAVGNLALNATTGTTNTAIGKWSLQYQGAANDNIGIGYTSGRYNAAGTRNVSIGTWSGYGVSGYSYSDNTYIGYRAGFGTSTGSKNIAIGKDALHLITEGQQNICIGVDAGNVLTTGDDNIIIGYNIDPSANNASDELNIGALIMGYLSAHGSGPAINLMGGTPQAKQAHIVDADGTLADITSKFNTLLADIEGYGLLATS